MTEKNGDRKPLENTEGIYTGNELLGAGKTDDNREWSRYKAYFKPKMDSDKKFSMTVFSPLKAKNTKQLNELVPGTRYKISYSTQNYTNKQGIPVTGKTAVGIYDAKQEQQQATTKPQQNALQPDLRGFDTFKVKYLNQLKQVPDLKPTAVHMLGSFIATTEKERVAALIALCQKAIKETEGENPPM